jgi:hypothetical protein
MYCAVSLNIYSVGHEIIEKMAWAKADALMSSLAPNGRSYYTTMPILLQVWRI